jgi:hypothetical protein
VLALEPAWARYPVGPLCAVCRDGVDVVGIVVAPDAVCIRCDLPLSTSHNATDATTLLTDPLGDAVTGVAGTSEDFAVEDHGRTVRLSPSTLRRLDQWRALDTARRQLSDLWVSWALVDDVATVATTAFARTVTQVVSAGAQAMGDGLAFSLELDALAAASIAAAGVA